jgi:hypothetical protein
MPNPGPVSVTKINITNIANVYDDIAVDMATHMDADMGNEVYDDVAITTHLFMSQYQKWLT